MFQLEILYKLVYKLIHQHQLLLYNQEIHYHLHQQQLILL
jgi:hypothetical protein